MPNEFVSVDEELLLWVVLHQEVDSFKQCIRNKRPHFIIKLFSLCETTFFFYQNIDYSVQTNNLQLIKINQDNKQIFHAFLFNIRNYSSEVINIQRHEAELNIISPRVNNFDIKQKRHEIFVLLYATNTKQDLGR